jgi:chromosome segregation ATPase
MAGKLRDDQIRWILSLDAKGVQSELVQVSATIAKLTNQNAMWSAEIKESQKQMDEAAKEMRRLENAGLTSSAAYQQLKGTFESAKSGIEDYRNKINENNKAIAEEKARFEELNKTLKIEDMTMNQLRQRSSELQKQLNATSLSTNPRAYQALQRELL